MVMVAFNHDKDINGGNIMMTDKIDGLCNYLLKKSEDSNRPITNKVLQKLLYYSQAWNLVINNGQAMFEDKIEAWVHGPAIPAVYRKYSKYGYSAISDKATTDKSSLLSNEEKSIVDQVWDLYGSFDGDYLEALTHREDPWLKARAGKQPFESSNKVISLTEMKKYYGKRLKEASASA